MVVIDKEKCVGCGKCVLDCVEKNIEFINGKASIKHSCLQCGHCVAICNNNAVSIPDYDMDDVDLIDENNKISPEVFLNCIKARRSIRDFTKEKISDKKIRLLAEAGRYTATAKNGQFHKFIFVQEDLVKLQNIVWKFIDNIDSQYTVQADDYKAYKAFSKQKKENESADFLFRNAPAVLFITSERHLDAGMAAQNIEMMAYTMGIGAMFNGYLTRIADENPELKSWLGIDNDTICACMLLGYPNHKYHKTAPRKKANVAIF